MRNRLGYYGSAPSRRLQAGRTFMTTKARVSRRLGMVVGATALTLSMLSFDSAAIAGQVRWNEVPAPTGDRTIARSFPTAFRTDTVDIPIPGNDGDLEY